MEERTGKVTFKGNPITLVGHPVEAGDDAPDVTLWKGLNQPVKLSSAAGKVLILSVTPSVDTGVCNKQVHAFNERAASLGGVQIWNVSVDLPFALSRYCGAEGIAGVQALSDYKDRELGASFGVYMKELGLLARSVFVIDAGGTVRYVEIVPEMTTEPDYDAAIEAARKLL
ncbi:MAG: putative thiol peroxidase [Myxococcales bacterium]